MMYVPYGSITMMRTYDGSSSSPRLAISPSAHTVTVTITDGTLSKSCPEARVTVEDREPPVIVCADDVYQDHILVDAAFYLKSISDNSGRPFDVFFLPAISQEASYPVGTTTYTFTIIDRAGNNASCSLNVTVEIDVTCNSVESDRSNVFDTYNVTVSGSTSYTFTFDPAEYGPTNRLPVGTNEVTVTAYPVSSPSTAIGSCTFNVTVSLQELPIVCPGSVDLTIGTDSGEPFYTYQDPQFNVTYLPESMMYIPYGSITMMRTYGGSSSSPRLAISPSAHTVTITISDGTLSQSCTEARVTVEDRESPVIVCPDDIYQYHTSVDSAFQLKDSSDNSGELLSTTLYPFINARDGYPVGTTTYTFTVSDRAGNSASCSVNVTIGIASTSTSTEGPQTPTSQDVTCNSVESDRSNFFDTYDVTVSGRTNYNLTFDPAEYGPTMRLPVGTNEVTVTAYTASSPSTAIGSCTFNITVSLQELPIVCPGPVDLTFGTDSGEPFYTYQDPQFDVTYLPESMTYVPYGSITMMRTYGGSSSSPRLAISPSAHTVTVMISDGTLSKSCTEARVTVEGKT
eukprot:XP_011661888.1 PREDICTED: hyalin-like [Strongylocentrotus purpuratus]